MSTPILLFCALTIEGARRTRVIERVSGEGRKEEVKMRAGVVTARRA
jgi:hypothetical protein